MKNAENVSTNESFSTTKNMNQSIFNEKIVTEMISHFYESKKNFGRLGKQKTSKWKKAHMDRARKLREVA